MSNDGELNIGINIGINATLNSLINLGLIVELSGGIGYNGLTTAKGVSQDILSDTIMDESLELLKVHLSKELSSQILQDIKDL